MARNFLAKERFNYDLGIVNARASQIAAVIAVVGFARHGRPSADLGAHVREAVAAGKLLEPAVIGALATVEEFEVRLAQALTRNRGELSEDLTVTLTSRPLGLTVRRDRDRVDCIVSHGSSNENSLTVREVDVMLLALGLSILPKDIGRLPELQDDDAAEDFTRRWVKRANGDGDFGVWVSAFDDDQFDDGDRTELDTEVPPTLRLFDAAG